MSEDDDNVPLEPRVLLEEMVMAIVQDQEQVKVQEIRDVEEPEKMILQVQVGDNDRGIVIGRNGFVAQLLRHFLGLVGQRMKQRIEVRIDAGPNHKPKPKVHNKPYRAQNGHFPVPQQGYVMVPASAVMQVPNNYNGNNNRRGNYRPRRTRDQFED